MFGPDVAHKFLNENNLGTSYLLKQNCWFVLMRWKMKVMKLRRMDVWLPYSQHLTTAIRWKIRGRISTSVAAIWNPTSFNSPRSIIPRYLRWPTPGTSGVSFEQKYIINNNIKHVQGYLTMRPYYFFSEFNIDYELMIPLLRDKISTNSYWSVADNPNIGSLMAAGRGGEKDTSWLSINYEFWGV